ncbi:MAG: RDD family protein [Blastocatellales bacterium]
MKCESCGNELTGGAIICRVCNHNNALRGDWRSQRAGQQTAPRRPGETQPNQSRATSPMTELPRIVPRKDADANLIHFPPAANKQEIRQTEAPRLAPQPMAITESEADTSAYPPWRAELKERVRQIREKRNTGDLVAPASPPDELNEIDLDRNPIVESALNRIRWSPHTPSVTSTVSASTQGSRAAAAVRLTQPGTDSKPAPAPELKPQPRPEPRPESRGETRFASPKPNQANQPAVNKADDQPKPQIANLPVNRNVNQAGPQANNPYATRPAVNRVETKTLTPKTHREADTRPEPKPAPAPAPVSKILTPRAKPQTAAEPKTEPRQERRGPETTARTASGRPAQNKPLAGAPDKHVATQVIEIAQAPEPPPLPEAEPASLWVRTLAGACDFEIVATTYLPIFGAYAVLNTSLGPESFFIMVLLLSAIAFIYQMVMLKFAGRTFGMAMLNLNLVNTDDESMPITRRQMTLRAVAATFAFLFPPLNYLFTRLTLSHRSLPDLISGTTVTGQ